MTELYDALQRTVEQLRRADGLVIWEHLPHAPPGIQEDIVATIYFASAALANARDKPTGRNGPGGSPPVMRGRRA